MTYKLFNTPLLFTLPLLMLCACSVSRTNVEDAKNLEYHLKVFLSDASHAQELIKAIQNSAQTFEKEQKPKLLYNMYEEVYAALPSAPLPMDQIKDHARVKSYILSTYTFTANIQGHENRARKFLRSIREDFAPEGVTKDAFLPVIDDLIRSLDEEPSPLP